MSDDDILAIVAALEFVASRDETPAPKSRWKAASRAYEGGDGWCHPEVSKDPEVTKGRIGWKNS